MAVKVHRREFLAGAAGAAVTASIAFPAIAQPKPVRIGLLTVKTGPLAAGGIQMEQGTIRFLKDRSYTMAGRKVELIVADTGGNPAGTKTKTQELVERDNVDMIFGPLAAFELLAITDYTAQAKMPVLSLAAAEDMTQRRPNPYFVRVRPPLRHVLGSGEAQHRHLGLRRVVRDREQLEGSEWPKDHVYVVALDELLSLGLGAGGIAAGVGHDELDLAPSHRVAAVLEKTDRALLHLNATRGER